MNPSCGDQLEFFCAARSRCSPWARVLAITLGALVPSAAADGAITTTAATERLRYSPVTDAVSIGTLQQRLQSATDLARDRGVELSITVLDRVTGMQVTNGSNAVIETASVSKLFIADDILFRAPEDTLSLDDDDRELIELMLRSSDDSAAEQLWTRFGRTDIVDRVSSRYRLSTTTVVNGAEWWRTRTTMTDVVTYYDALLAGSGGLEAADSEVILGDLGRFTDSAADGYYQRFGLPDALQLESSIAIKQGWMCCIDGDWIHLTTGIVGADQRYVVAASSREPASTYGSGANGAEHARRTLTDVIATLFPRGRIEL